MLTYPSVEYISQAAMNAGHTFRPSFEQCRAFYCSPSWSKSTARKNALSLFKRCLCCGSPVHLVADHIKPIRFYWNLRFDYNNVQVLCEYCNVGKGSWDATDWRYNPALEDFRDLSHETDSVKRYREIKTLRESIARLPASVTPVVNNKPRWRQILDDSRLEKHTAAMAHMKELEQARKESAKASRKRKIAKQIADGTYKPRVRKNPEDKQANGQEQRTQECGHRQHVHNAVPELPVAGVAFDESGYLRKLVLFLRDALVCELRMRTKMPDKQACNIKLSLIINKTSLELWPEYRHLTPIARVLTICKQHIETDARYRGLWSVYRYFTGEDLNLIPAITVGITTVGVADSLHDDAYDDVFE